MECDASPVVLGVAVQCAHLVWLSAVLVARPSLCDLLLKTRRIVGVENRPVSTLALRWCRSVLSVVCLTY